MHFLSYFLDQEWLHPAARIIPTDNTKEESTPINIYTDGSKSEKVVGAGIAIIRPRTTTVKLMYRMDTTSTNNQAEALEILKALEYIQTTQINEEEKAATVHKDSRTTLDEVICDSVSEHNYISRVYGKRILYME